MGKHFFEREPMLAKMQDALVRLDKGGGHIVLIDGEPGVGKTTLVDHFCHSAATRYPVFRSCCESLFSPHPFGPFEEILRQAAQLTAQVETEHTLNPSIFQGVMALLKASQDPIILVIEDIHWADERSLDLIRFMARRLADSKCFLILTVRDHDLNSNEIVREMSGALGFHQTTRLHLDPLSPESVDQMLGDYPGDRQELQVRSGGNPFYVEQMCASAPDSAPASIRESVMGRLSKLSSSQRELCEVASVFPREIETHWLEHIASAYEPNSKQTAFCQDDIDPIVQAGILRWNAQRLEFSHEIMRSALEEALPPMRRRALHKQALAAKMADLDAPKAHLVHHAENAGQIDVVLKLTLQAATQAQNNGALREAAKYYVVALKYLDHADPEIQAKILTGWGVSSSLTGEPSHEAIQALLKALEICSSDGKVLAASAILRRLSMVYMFNGDVKAATQMAGQAVQILEQEFSVRPSHLLGLAYAQAAFCSMVHSDRIQTQAWADKALHVAASLTDEIVLAHTLVNLGSALFRAGAPNGKSMLSEGLRLSLKNHCIESALIAYLNLGEVLISQYALSEARETLQQGLEFAQETGMLQYYFVGLLCQVNALSGDLASSHDYALTQLEAADAGLSAVGWPLLQAYGLASSRLNTGEATKLLEQSLALSLELNLPRFVLPSALSLVEHYWLQSNVDAARSSLLKAWNHQGREENPWMIGALHLWNSRLANPIGLSISASRQAVTTQPHRLELDGKIDEAAQAWNALSASFEAGLCLLLKNDVTALLEADKIFLQLGVKSANAPAKRGQYGAGKINPDGLSTREQQILKLMLGGLSNALIAKQLHRSERTVEHHVSSILSKCGARNRADILLASFKVKEVNTRDIRPKSV
jgi:DNA-binding CsgD family transcriptional regulator